MSAKWIDVGTTAIPRLLTERCIGSLLDRMDATGYRLRWIFHLDVLPWMKDRFQENMRQAERVAKRFDDAVLIGATENQTYGGACHRVFRETRHDTLWVEDDYLWHKPFRLRDVEDASEDGFNFHQPHVRMGATSPGFWRRDAIRYLLRHFPRPFSRANERALKHVLHYRGGFRSNGSMGNVPLLAMVDISRECSLGRSWVDIIDAYASFRRRIGKPPQLSDDKCVVTLEDAASAAENVKENALSLAVVRTHPTGDAVVAAVRSWWPKVRKGGMLCGYTHRDDRWDTVAGAVKETASQRGLQPRLLRCRVWCLEKLE